MKITNDYVYGLEKSIIASGFPRMTKVFNETEFAEAIGGMWEWAFGLPMVDGTYFVDSKTAPHVDRAKRLGQVDIGDGDDGYLKGIIVQMNITAPQYFWPQIQRYHFSDIISSQSKMHSIVEFDMDAMCNEYVTRNTVNEINKYIQMYNNYEKGQLVYLVLRDGSAIPYTKRNLFYMIISNCPMGLEITARMTTSYLQLKTQYHQRKHHRLDEWSEVFCKWVEGLPKFKELILGEE